MSNSSNKFFQSLLTSSTIKMNQSSNNSHRLNFQKRNTGSFAVKRYHASLKAYHQDSQFRAMLEESSRSQRLDCFVVEYRYPFPEGESKLAHPDINRQDLNPVDSHYFVKPECSVDNLKTVVETFIKQEPLD